MTDPQDLWEAYWEQVPPSREAEAALYAHYEPLVKMIVGKHFGTAVRSDPHLGEDLRQAARIGLVEVIRRYRPENGTFEGYANRSVWGKVMHAFAQHEKRRIAASLDEPGRAGFAPGPGSGSDPAGEEGNPEEPAHPGSDALELLWKSENAAIFGRALRRMTGEQRAVLRAVVEDDLTFRQVARRLGIPAAQVEARYREALFLVRGYTVRYLERFTQNQAEFSAREKPASPIRGPGRPKGRKFTRYVAYLADPVTREMSLKIAAFFGLSEARVHREAIREKYLRLRREHPDDPRLRL